jgi:integrase
MLKKTLKTLEIEGITTQSLRHTFGTRCIESGMAPVVVQTITRQFLFLYKKCRF